MIANFTQAAAGSLRPSPRSPAAAHSSLARSGTARPIDAVVEPIGLAIRHRWGRDEREVKVDQLNTLCGHEARRSAVGGCVVEVDDGNLRNRADRNPPGGVR